MEVNGYDIIINDVWGEKVVSCGWKNGRCYEKLPRKVVQEIQKRMPDANIKYVLRHSWNK